MDEKRKLTIAELETILDGPPQTIRILPNGELVTTTCAVKDERDRILKLVEGVVKKLRKKADSPVPTDRAIGLDDGADELETAIKQIKEESNEVC